MKQKKSPKTKQKKHKGGTVCVLDEDFLDVCGTGW